ncbi:hypothetical protein EGX98_04660 [Fusobacterium necrophorum]|uniref:Holin of 3TMs, for gene-transfer release n=1 Tax=Fusobacterium necrophorum BL TaxID=1441732 RepID=A0AB73BXA3_9FUSO|nr:hypothetical protein [Fusobacterium necrophorum]AYZ73391.1 hypothetical protein EGX98_04660 [Fusobacterium necrophorum]AZW08612.1 hypothetical protein EO219_02765 [Fusobacterium necrophorum subsp. necrophorum]KDE63752.1 hypothetical protein FUSO3_04245 [Fusobacterium necrophorum BL]KDE74936.1 hypothetical protein FUSO7_00215 [Fusobacterium necrophorum BFTR-2]MBR8732799.1 hypothetical protein [Fusobacterium necrophorum]
MSVTLGTIMGSTIGKKVIDKLLDVIEKRIPISADQRQQLEVELAKMEVEELKVKTEYVKSLGTVIRDWIIPAGLASYFLMHILIFGSDFIHAQLGQELPIIPINPDFSEVIKVLIGFLFTYKGVSKFSGKK